MPAPATNSPPAPDAQGFRFDNSYAAALPDAMYTRLNPIPVRAPEMVVLNDALAEELGLDFSAMSTAEQARLFSGNTLPDGAAPIAQAYAGHQFGFFNILGDGRAIVWGEHIAPNGTRYDIQFKGSGPTPYSRSGDGRAALGPMLREYIISESMHALGIPTTRSLAVATTGETVARQDILPGAVLTRVAQSHIRVGTFEFVAAHQKRGMLDALLDYTIQRHAPELADADNQARALLETVIERQAELIVQWMRVGFIHGVMNTDNMVISGESIDYGPCAFMDEYHPAKVFSSIDQQGRYAYANQPPIAQWNLARFAETLLPLLHPDMDKAVAIAEETVNGFTGIFRDKWLAMMRAKLGLVCEKPGEQFDDDQHLASDLLEWMGDTGADFTNTFHDLISPDIPQGDIYDSRAFAGWHARWQARIAQNPAPEDENTSRREAAFVLMRAHNPAVIPRNHKVEEALNAAEGENRDMAPFHKLMAAMAGPYDDRPDQQEYKTPPEPGERVNQTFCGT